MIYRSRYHYPWRWAILAEICWRIEHLPLREVARRGYVKRKACEHRGYAAGVRTCCGDAIAADRTNQEPRHGCQSATAEP